MNLEKLQKKYNRRMKKLADRGKTFLSIIVIAPRTHTTMDRNYPTVSRIRSRSSKVGHMVGQLNEKHRK